MNVDADESYTSRLFLNNTIIRQNWKEPPDKITTKAMEALTWTKDALFAQFTNDTLLLVKVLVQSGTIQAMWIH